MFVRVEVAVRPEFQDPASLQLLRKIELANPELRRNIRWARLLDVYWLNIDDTREKVIPVLIEVFRDPVLNWLFTGDLIPSAAGRHGGVEDLFESSPYRSGKFWGIEKRFRPGVTDNVARTTKEALEIILRRAIPEGGTASGQLLLIEGQKIGEKEMETLAQGIFCNDLIESWTLLPEAELRESTRFSSDHIRREFPKVTIRGKAQVETVPLQALSDADLEQLSKKRLWALSLPEMKAIQSYYADAKIREARQQRGLSPDPTDVEMEILAQTWSEHCKHKIFNALVDYRDGNNVKQIPSQIDSLFKQTISGSTSELPRPWLLSVFSDNAGVIALDEEDAICIKVETHNSPSALDPYGGALTGIVGVNRDILGTGRGARCLANTDVFCVAPVDYSQHLPDGILHPRRILEGIRRGVEHGGNKSGIPTVNGALLFDPRYLGKPLVFCGTVGILPRFVTGGAPSEKKEIQAGDRICMVGGRIGKDGIHGATFSSLALDESAPATAVQLGDPITQKRMADFLIEARDQGLYRTLTDNGAGGLSSSVGELATLSGGALMDVSLAKTKYAGLKPYELVVSESQERMTVAVPPDRMNEFLALANRRSVEVSDLGEFTQTGIFEVRYQNEVVAALDLEFLHKGTPRMRLDAEWVESEFKPGSVDISFEKEGAKHLVELLSRPNVASKEWLIRQYDHEVQGTSVVKPLHTAHPGTADAQSGPNDAGVIKPKENSWVGVAIGCGINPKLSDVDPYLMAQAAVDEAVRNVLCVGAEYGLDDSVMALVDNFCWPDPVGDPLKSAWLVRACYGMRDAVLGLGVPLVSGKDSMKNDYRGRKDGKPLTISVPPTLLMTAVARVRDVRLSRTSDFKTEGDQIYLLGGRDFGLMGSELHAMYADRLRERGGNDRQVVLPSSAGLKTPKPDWKAAKPLYAWLGGTQGEAQRSLRSVHDLSEGGLLAALAEGLIAKGMGADVEFPAEEDPWVFGFGEGFHSFVVSIRDAEAPMVEEEWARFGIGFHYLGTVTQSGVLEVNWRSRDGGRSGWKANVRELREAWKKEGYWE